MRVEFKISRNPTGLSKSKVSPAAKITAVFILLLLDFKSSFPESVIIYLVSLYEIFSLIRQPSFKRELIYLLTEPREIFRYSDIFL